MKKDIETDKKVRMMKDKKRQKMNLIVSLLELTLVEKILMSKLNLVGQLFTLMNQMIKESTKKSIKKSLIDRISKILLKFEFKTTLRSVNKTKMFKICCQKIRSS